MKPRVLIARERRPDKAERPKLRGIQKGSDCSASGSSPAPSPLLHAFRATPRCVGPSRIKAPPSAAENTRDFTTTAAAAPAAGAASNHVEGSDLIRPLLRRPGQRRYSPRWIRWRCCRRSRSSRRWNRSRLRRTWLPRRWRWRILWRSLRRQQAEAVQLRLRRSGSGRVQLSPGGRRWQRQRPGSVHPEHAGRWPAEGQVHGRRGRLPRRRRHQRARHAEREPRRRGPAVVLAAGLPARVQVRRRRVVRRGQTASCVRGHRRPVRSGRRRIRGCWPLRGPRRPRTRSVRRCRGARKARRWRRLALVNPPSASIHILVFGTGALLRHLRCVTVLLSSMVSVSCRPLAAGL